MVKLRLRDCSKLTFVVCYLTVALEIAIDVLSIMLVVFIACLILNWSECRFLGRVR